MIRAEVSLSQRQVENAKRRRRRAMQRERCGHVDYHKPEQDTVALRREHDVERQQAEAERAAERDRIKQTRFYRPVWAEGDQHV